MEDFLDLFHRNVFKLNLCWNATSGKKLCSIVYLLTCLLSVLSTYERNNCDSFSKAPEFPEFASTVLEAINALGGCVFPKLNWSAPRVKHTHTQTIEFADVAKRPVEPLSPVASDRTPTGSLWTARWSAAASATSSCSSKAPTSSRTTSRRRKPCCSSYWQSITRRVFIFM